MAAGRIHRFPIRVYYEDTDAAGIVYYANYLKFAERGRTEMLRERGFEHRRIRAEQGLAFVVRRCVIDYHRPARLDDALWVETAIARIGRASLDLAQVIRTEDNILVSLEVRLALLNEKLRPVRVPAALIAALEAQH
jgi:acyl-CoA thioester hydrolase